MSIMSDLRAHNLRARKDKDTVASNLTTTLISEAAMVGKNDGNRETTDEEVIRVVKKFLDNAKETQGELNKRIDELFKKSTVSDGLDEAVWRLQREIEILQRYMPKQMMEEELRAVIKTYKTENDDSVNLGQIMKYLQANFAGQYDGKLASQVAKEL